MSQTPTHSAGCEARRSFRASAGALSKSVDVAGFAAVAIVGGRLCRAVRRSDAIGPFERLLIPPCSSPRVDASERVEFDPSDARDFVREVIRERARAKTARPREEAQQDISVQSAGAPPKRDRC